MKVHVKLYASLKRFAENDTFTLDIEPMNVKSLIDYIGIPEMDVGIVLINDKNADYSDLLNENDSVQMFTELKGG